jgi:hypothetical protein
LKKPLENREDRRQFTIIYIEKVDDQTFESICRKQSVMRSNDSTLVITPRFYHQNTPLEKMILSDQRINGFEKSQRPQAANMIERYINSDVVDDAFDDLDLTGDDGDRVDSQSVVTWVFLLFLQQQRQL